MKWNYAKWGSCPNCDSPEERLFKPDVNVEGLKVVLFNALCKGCIAKLDKEASLQSLNFRICVCVYEHKHGHWECKFCKRLL